MITLAPDDNVVSEMITFSPRLIPLVPDDNIFITDGNILSQMITIAPDDNIASQMIIFRPR